MSTEQKDPMQEQIDEALTWYLGDDKHPLCSEDCADAYEAENKDYEMTDPEDGYHQTSGCTEVVYGEFGDVCLMCGVECLVTQERDAT